MVPPYEAPPTAWRKRSDWFRWRRTSYGEIAGLGFASVFFAIFFFSERHHEIRKAGEKHKHLEQFNQASTEDLTTQGLRLTKPYRKLVAIRSTQNLVMLEKALADTDPETTDVIVMTAKRLPKGEEAHKEGV